MTDNLSLEEIHLMIIDCQRRESKLSEWEVDFIKDLSNLSHHRLYKKQIVRLEKIWERVTTK